MRSIRPLVAAAGTALLALQISASPRPSQDVVDASAQGTVSTPPALPSEPFTRPAERSHAATDLVFGFDQLDYYYRVPGEFTHRLTGDQYGFEALSFMVTETHPGGGPGLHVHDTEEAHVVLRGDVEYRIGGRTFTIHGPYIARVPPGMPHTFRNVGTAPFNMIAVFASKHPETRRVGPNPLIGGAATVETAPRGDVRPW